MQLTVHSSENFELMKKPWLPLMKKNESPVPVRGAKGTVVGQKEWALDRYLVTVAFSIDLNFIHFLFKN